MMDFSAINEVLQNGSDEDIITSMRNGTIPSHMAIAELQSRARTRKAGPMQPPQQGVNDVMERNSMPVQQDIPVQPQLNQNVMPQKMAGGGLVSFKHGGEVKRFFGGGSTGYTGSWEDAYNPDEQTLRDRYMMDKIGASYKDRYFGMPVNAIGNAAEGTLRGIPRVLRAFGADVEDLPDYARVPMIGDRSLTPYSNAAKAEYESKRGKARTKEMELGNYPSTHPARTGANWDENNRPAVADIPYERPTVGGDTGGIAGIRMSGRVGGGGSTGGMRDITVPGVTMPNAPDYSKYADQTTAESAGKMYDENVGANEGLAAREQRLAGKEASLAEDSRRAPWLALMKAGLGMAASRNRSVLGAAGEGGIAGLNDYIISQNELNRRDDQLFDRRSTVEDARRADKLARFGFVQGEARKGLESRNQVGIKGLDTKYQGDLEGVKMNAEQGFRQATLNQRQNADDQAHRVAMAQLQVSKAQAAKLSDYETFLKLSANDPENYKVVTKDGKQVRILDTAKITNDFKSYGKSNSAGLDDDTILRTLNKGLADGTIPEGTTFYDYKNSLFGGGITPTTAPRSNNILR